MREEDRRPHTPSLVGTSLVGSVLGRYALVRLLGIGGMGAVYEATHLDLGRRAAIKTLHERYGSAPDARQRFLLEGQAAARIRHSNVADVYDVGIDGEHPYLVMELLDGENLARLIEREAPLSVQRTADLLVPVVAAVAAAHDQGVVHRDLKPENIFLCTDRQGIKPKVLDFGISKLHGPIPAPALTETGVLLGTPHYMSPEQAQGTKDVDARSDQYSLGVILYECVTGCRPMQGAPLYALLHRTVQGDFPPPRQLLPSLPAAFEGLVLQAMARRRESRFPTTRALGAALLACASERVRSDYAVELTVERPSAPRASASAPEQPAHTSDPRQTDTATESADSALRARGDAVSNEQRLRDSRLASVLSNTLGAQTAAVRRAGSVDNPPREVSSGSSSLFVGRDGELGQLRRLWQRADAGRGGVMFLSGEPGMGKTLLVQQFVARLRREMSPCLIATGRCLEQYGASEAFLPFLDVVGVLLRGRERARVAAALRRAAPTWLGAPFPASFRSTLRVVFRKRRARAGKACFANWSTLWVSWRRSMG